MSLLILLTAQKVKTSLVVLWAVLGGILDMQRHRNVSKAWGRRYRQELMSLKYDHSVLASMKNASENPEMFYHWINMTPSITKSLLGAKYLLHLPS